MRTTKLLWFALGAGTAGLLSLMANWYFEPTMIDDGGVPYFILSEQTKGNQAPQGKAGGGGSEMADKAGDILRRCGARVFEMTAGEATKPPTAELPIVDENIGAIPCVVDNANKAQLTLEVANRWSSPAFNELRSKN